MYIYINALLHTEANIIFNPRPDYRAEISKGTPKIQTTYYAELGWPTENINVILRVFVPDLFALITSYIFNRGLFYFPGIKIVFRNHVLLISPPPTHTHPCRLSAYPYPTWVPD